MSNVLSEEKKQQVIALGKLGWPLRRIEQATGVRRETASAYLKSVGVVVCLPGWGRRAPAKPAIGVTPDFIAPFSEKQGAPKALSPPSASVCEAYRELIEQGLARGRNGKAIWQDLVSDHGFAGGYQAVKRFGEHNVPKRRALSSRPPEKKLKSTTAVVRWCANRRVASIAARGYSC
jgi:transposase